MYLEKDASYTSGAECTDLLYRGFRVSLSIPCYNEAISIARVIREFKSALPQLSVQVFDNHSSDRTADIAAREGAQVHHVKLRGKGNVVRRIFADVESDIYVLVDGDATYDATAVKTLVDRLIDERLDMVVGCRHTSADTAETAYRRGHRWGNRLLTNSVARIFGEGFSDMLSGYRVFSRRYAKSFPAASKGFEIETELTVHALELRMPYGEVDTAYGARELGSSSKLSTYRDGVRILWMIFRLYVSERPLAFFSICSAMFAVLSIGLAVPIFIEYFEVGLVPRLPTAVLSASCMMMSMLALLAGLILDTVTRGRQEVKRLWYLSVSAEAR